MPVKLRRGDLFEGSADLIVLPCSTIPTVANFVQARLQKHDIPVPSKPMDLGEVSFQPFKGAEQLALSVAYAASVKAAHESEPEAIRLIGAALGEFATRNQNVGFIKAPLLGTGAGGLPTETSVEQLRNGFTETAATNATLQICILEEDEFMRLSDHFGGGTGRTQPVRVFISYTETSPQHGRWVAVLADYLRTEGIEARFDQLHLPHGMDIAQWMVNELDMADRVLLICDELYAQKADGRHGGVGFETMLVIADTVRAGTEGTDKYIPIIRSEDVDKGMPRFFSGRDPKYIHWPEDSRGVSKREELLQALLRVAGPASPPGPPPVYL